MGGREKRARNLSWENISNRMRCHCQKCSDALTRILLLLAQNVEKKWADTNQKLVAISRDQLSE